MGTEPTLRYAAKLDEARGHWPEGPWTHEPDRVEWRTRVGLPGLILRNFAGALCGYVAVPPGHPMHGKNCDAVNDHDLPSHGGFTYANRCGGAICHVPAAGESDDVWWLGFDCAHGGCDVIPAFVTMFSEHEIVLLDMAYRDVAYVRGVCEELAAALAAMITTESDANGG